MIRALLLAVSAAALFAGAPAARAACSCTTYQSAQQFVGFSDVIFKGKAISSKTQYGSTVTNFQVLEMLKGDPAQAIAVTHPAAGPNACGGVAFKPGQIVIIVGQGMQDDLGTTSCQINAYSEAQLKAALRAQ